jgi:hypothetical protein
MLTFRVPGERGQCGGPAGGKAREDPERIGVTDSFLLQPGVSTSPRPRRIALSGMISRIAHSALESRRADLTSSGSDFRDFLMKPLEMIGSVL